MLDSLRRELSDLDAHLESGRQREQDVLTELDGAERQVVLLEALVARQQELVRTWSDSMEEVSAEIAPLEGQLADLGNRILDIEESRDRMGRALSRTLLAERRMRQWGQLELLVGSANFHEFVSRWMLLGRLRDVQANRLAALKSSADSALAAEAAEYEYTRRLRERHASLESGYAHATEIAQNLLSDFRRLTGARRSLETRLGQVRKSRELLESRRREVVEAQRAIREMIQRVAGGEHLAGVPLDLLRGSLPWPAEGRVVQAFGEVRNQELATVTENPGIDLVVSRDSPVTAVADGRVSAVTWLRGYGNVCIMEHPGNYRTVYARLGKTTVSAHEEVRAGVSLGSPWFDPVSGDYRIHFELWSGKEKKNPLEWLRPH